MTPYQLRLHAEVFNEKKKLEDEEKLRLTYLNSLWTSRFVWQKTVKSFDEFMGTTKKKEMTAEEMLNEIKKLNASFGGTVY